MKNVVFFCLSIFTCTASLCQTYQVNLVGAGITKVFNDVKFDPADGGTINVGYINDPLTGTGNDCFITKLNSSQQIVWQKIISNMGNDQLNKIFICSNGDYIVAGKIFTGGILRGLVCRINSNDGSTIWSTSSSLITTLSGEEFFDLIETVNHNIAVVGYTNFNPPNTRGIIVLLNSAGQEVYTRISNYVENSTGYRTIIQLPNNNLLISGLYFINGSYSGVILEMNELTTDLVSQNTYTINAGVAGINTSINSLQIVSCKTTPGGNIYFQADSYTGSSTGPVVECIYEYDAITKNLAGNIYYHVSTDNPVALTFQPIAAGDLLISQSFTDNIANREYVSRVTNGSIIYDRQVNGNIAVFNTALKGHILSLCGSNNVVTDVNAYALFSADANIPASAGPCLTTDENTLAFATNNLSPTPNLTPLINGSSMANFISANVNTNFTVSSICGAVLPVSLITFTAMYNRTDNNVLLRWSTTNEINSKIFNLEKSVDGAKNFAEIGSLMAHGSGSSLNQYGFSDPNPSDGINFYRLKQIDVDGRFSYSNILSVIVPTGRSTTNFSIYPNPASRFAFINATASGSQKITVEILDAAGRIQRRDQYAVKNNNPVRLDFDGINNGIYFIKIFSENSVQTKRLVITNK